MTTSTTSPTPSKSHTRSIINSAYVKAFALQAANRSHPGRFSRVGSCFLEEFTAEVERMLVAKVRRHPSRGVTLLSSFSVRPEE